MESKLPTQSWLRWEKDHRSFLLVMFGWSSKIIVKSFLSSYTGLFLLMELEIADSFFFFFGGGGGEVRDGAFLSC